MPIVSLKSVIEVPGFFFPEPVKLELGAPEIVYTGVVEVSASGTQAINFGVITTASFVFIRVNSAATYVLNGGSDNITINSGGVVILYNVSVTALSVTETAAAAMNLEVLLAGT